jgi:formate dehydrogenase
MFKPLTGVQRSDCENADVAIYLGKNPWHTHGFHQCRKKLQKLSKKDGHKIVVVDPRRTESADIADMHVAVKNGTDAWMMAALVAIMIQEDWVDHAWMQQHTVGFDEVYPFFFDIPVAEYCKQCGVEEAQLRELARWIHEAESVAVWEDLGVQMNIHSTLVSYLQRLLLTITGNFGKKGAQFIAQPLVSVVSPSYRDDRRTPVTQSRIIGGLIPCNVVSEEILADHPDKMRALWIDGSNAVHSYASSKDMVKALRATEITVVVDIAMTETAMEADYILPSPTQYEKAEMSMFQFEFPHNVAHLRHPVFDAPETVLEEAEIYARLCEALDAVPQPVIDTLNNALAQGEQAFAEAFFKVMGENPGLTKMVPVILYRTLGNAMPERLAVAAGYMPLCLDLAMKNPEAVKAAGHKGEGIELGMNLFKALVNSPSGTVITHEAWDASYSRLGHTDKKIHLHLPEMIPELQSLAQGFTPLTSAEFPFVLSCGERRDYTANGIYRDPNWRKKDYDCALRMNPVDAESMGLVSGQRVRISTREGDAETVVEVNDRMQPGHISLPNGGGLKNNLNTAVTVEQVGAATNDLTSVTDRDFLAGTPWHKYVPAKVERISA